MGNNTNSPEVTPNDTHRQKPHSDFWNICLLIFLYMLQVSSTVRYVLLFICDDLQSSVYLIYTVLIVNFSLVSTGLLSVLLHQY